jgi:O-antigen/teichoic acid export membrane protein
MSFSDMADVALIDMAMVSFTLLNMAIMNLPYALIPAVSDRFTRTKEIPEIDLNPLVKITLIIFLLIACTGLLGIDRYFIGLILGVEYLPMLLPLYILCLSLPFYTYVIIVQSVFQGVGKVALTARNNLIALLISLPILILTSIQGIVGVSIGMLFVNIIWSLIYYRVYRIN